MAGYETRERNREILSAWKQGASLEALASHYRLSLDRIRYIIRWERHLEEVSPDPFYRTMRESQPT